MEKSIPQLLQDFARSFDEKDWKLMLTCLAAKIHTDYSSFRGTPPEWQSAKEYVAKREKGMHRLITAHQLSNFVVAENAGAGTCHCRFVIKRFSSDQQFYHSYGYYDFKLVKEQGMWKIERIKQTVERNEGDRNLHGAFKKDN